MSTHNSHGTSCLKSVFCSTVGRIATKGCIEDRRIQVAEVSAYEGQGAHIHVRKLYCIKEDVCHAFNEVRWRRGNLYINEGYLEATI